VSPADRRAAVGLARVTSRLSERPASRSSSTVRSYAIAPCVRPTQPCLSRWRRPACRCVDAGFRHRHHRLTARVALRAGWKDVLAIEVADITPARCRRSTTSAPRRRKSRTS
jgi:hypothetical protein